MKITYIVEIDFSVNAPRESMFFEHFIHLKLVQVFTIRQADVEILDFCLENLQNLLLRQGLLRFLHNCAIEKSYQQKKKYSI